MVDRGRPVAADDARPRSVLLLLIAAFALATARGRRTLMSLDPLFALLVIVVLALPYLIWLIRAETLCLPPWPAIADLSARALHWGWLLGGLLLAMSGIVLLVMLNSGWFARNAEEAPIIYRPPVDPLARDFVYFFAIAPGARGKPDLRPVQSRSRGRRRRHRAVDVGTGRDRRDRRSDPSAAPAPVALGLGGGRRRAGAWSVIAATLFLPWTGSGEVRDLAAGAAIAHFFGDSFERRTNQRLRAVTGDRAACEPDRAGYRPSASVARRDAGADAVADAWRNSTRPAASWSGAPPTPPARRRPTSRRRFPGLVPEVPRAFEWLVNGRQPLLRIGWAIVRPKGP